MATKPKSKSPAKPKKKDPIAEALGYDPEKDDVIVSGPATMDPLPEFMAEKPEEPAAPAETKPEPGQIDLFKPSAKVTDDPKAMAQAHDGNATPKSVLIKAALQNFDKMEHDTTAGTQGHVGEMVGITAIEDKPLPEPAKVPTVPRYSLQPTDDPHVFRVVNRAGDWISYYNDVEKKYAYAVNHIIRGGFPKGEGFYNYLLSHSKDEAKRILTDAGEKGSRVHEAIRNLIDGIQIDLERPYKTEEGGWSPLTDEEWECLIAWCAWAEKYKPRVRQAEHSLWTPDYAGTLDFRGDITLPAGDKAYINDKLVTIKEDTVLEDIILDWKSGSAIHDEYKLQTASYAFGSKKPARGTGVVRVGTSHKCGYEMRLWNYEATKEHYHVFRAAMRSFNLSNPPYEHDDSTFPAILSASVPKVEEEKK